MREQRSLSSGKHSVIAVGAPSVIMIFVVLCLTCFAALSMVSANADMRLAQRSGENLSLWYAADARAQKRLQTLDGLVAAGTTDAETLAAQQFVLSLEDGRSIVTFYTKCGEYTAIETRAELFGESVELISSRTVLTQELEYTEIPFIWDGVTIYD